MFVLYFITGNCWVILLENCNSARSLHINFKMKLNEKWLLWKRFKAIRLVDINMEYQIRPIKTFIKYDVMLNIVFKLIYIICYTSIYFDSWYHYYCYNALSIFRFLNKFVYKWCGMATKHFKESVLWTSFNRPNREGGVEQAFKLLLFEWWLALVLHYLISHFTSLCKMEVKPEWQK